MVIKSLFIILLVLTLLPLSSAELQVGLGGEAGDIGINFRPSLNISTIVAGNFTNLSELLDTNVPSPNNNDVLTWSSSISKWIAQVGGGGGSNNNSWNQTKGDELYIAQGDEGNLNVNSSTWWAGLTGWVSGWFENVGDELSFNETKLNETIAEEGVRLGFNESTNVSVNFGANESDTSGPVIPFLLTDEGVLKINVEEITSSTIWNQSGNQIINNVGNILNFTGNITSSDRIILGNGVSIGFNSSCKKITYDSDGSVLSAEFCT